MLRRWLPSAVAAHAARLGRFARGAVGMGIAWSVSWGVAGVLLSPYLWTISHVATPRSLFDALGTAGMFGLMIGWYGFLTGAIFSVVLAVAARRRTLRELTKARMATWGVVSNLVFTVPPTVYVLARHAGGWQESNNVYLVVSTLLSAGCATASLMIARRAEAARERALYEEDTNADAVRAFLPANAMLRSGRHAVVMPATVEPERVPIP